MKGTFELTHPILLNGKNCNAFPYDTEEITSDLFIAACAKSTIGGSTANLSASIELNTALHLQLGKAAIIALDSSVDWGDLDRVKGFDLVRLMEIGRFFTSGKSEEPSEESTSDEPSDNTQKSST